KDRGLEKQFPRTAAPRAPRQISTFRPHSSNTGPDRTIENPAAALCRVRFVALRTKGNLHQPGLFPVALAQRAKRQVTRTPAAKHSTDRRYAKRSCSPSQPLATKCTYRFDHLHLFRFRHASVEGQT